MVTIKLNDEALRLERPLDLAGVLAQRGYAGTGFAVALNGAFVPRGQHTATRLRDGDEITVLTPMSGG